MSTQEISPILIFANSIISQDDLMIASTVRTEAKAELKRLKADKDLLLEPAKATVEEIKSRYKPREDALNALIDDINSKMIAYRTQLIIASQQATDNLAARVAKGTMRAETAIAKLDALTPVETTIGNTSFRPVQCFEVIDVTKLPKEYLLPNEPLIRKAMKEGVELSGVRYYTEQRPWGK